MEIEIPNIRDRRLLLTHVVFDFDGTISWLRHGWPGMMQQVFREHLTIRQGESEESLSQLLMDIILGLNGKPTIVQMTRFAELAHSRGHPTVQAQSLADEYQRRLDAQIERRSNSIRENTAAPDAFLVYGARRLLEHLIASGLQPVILSSTVEERVREEARLLDVARYFGPHIYGSSGNPLQFTKRSVYERLLAEEQVSGGQLLSFGDGPVEIAVAKQLGGLAVGVCSDEEVNGSGKLDPNKRQQLLQAGADVLVADFRDCVPLIQDLLGR